jgi:hypothetical protein
LITSAPKSDITVAAAGPAIKLAQSMTLIPSKMRSLTCVPQTSLREAQRRSNLDRRCAWCFEIASLRSQ